MQQFSDLVGEIYEAALDPAQWPKTLNLMAAAFGASFAGFGWEDTRIMAVGGSYGTQALAGEDAKRYRARYKEILVYSNPMRIPVLLTQEVEDVFTPGMLVPVAEYQASRYYREYVKPMGWGDGLSTILSKSDGVVHFLAFARAAAAPPFDDDNIAMLKLLSPHVRRAYTIGNLIGKQKAQVSALADAFDGLAAAVILLDDRMRVTYRNGSAQALLARGAPFVVIGDVLRPCASGDTVEFNLAVAACLRADAASSAERVSMVLSGLGDDRYVAHFLPLTTPTNARLTSSHAPHSAIFVTKVGLDAQSPIKTIADAYGLTPREMSVLVALVDIGGPTEIASQLGLTANTVKSHLKAIFMKTGVTRQADLVKLVASYVGPTTAAPSAPQP